MTSGLGKMPFYKFIFRDMPCCLLQVSLLFYLGHFLGENYTAVISTIKTYNTVFLVLFVGVLVGVLIKLKYRDRDRDRDRNI
jgi:membrane protein DedA with SNARE-associated domain